MIFRRFLLLVVMVLPRMMNAQQVIYSSYPTPDEFTVNSQFCCYQSSRIGWFSYSGPQAQLATVSLDAIMYYRGFLEVSFLTWDGPQSSSVVETWTGRSFSRANPLTFTNAFDVLGGNIYGLRVTALPGDDPEPQSIASAAVWRENLDRRSLFSPTSFVFEVTAQVDEPESGMLTLMATALLLLPVWLRRRCQSMRE